MVARRESFGDLPESVSVDLLESDSAYLLVVDLPGVSPETVDVSVDESELQIEARRGSDEQGEYRYLKDTRSRWIDVTLPLPADATGKDGEGRLERGVLEVRLPKSSETVTTTVPISLGNPQTKGQD